ncbi:BTB/POZ domain-containing protein KCTD19 isoform X2 [Caretta caretta]|uniref:BTB/POZ domain-containing protein KCTD19 isoform X2 n=1 Tax=Caretta caretta TaxID=8467 RepID=UPI003F4B4155
MKEPEIVNESTEEDSIHFNVGGWHFSIPKSKIAQFPESLLWKESSSLVPSENPRLFIDRDGFTFRHVHYYLHTSKLSFSSCAELNLLYEQALILQLTPLLQTLDNLKEGKHNLRVRPADIPIAERASMNYWRTQKCISKPLEFPIKSPAFTGNCSMLTSNLEDSMKGIVNKMLEVQEAERPPLYVMAFGVLVKYPDSALGQLHIESTLDRNQLYISGNGVLFQHVKNWLGTCRLPLTENMSEIHELCDYLDKRDITYEPMKDALKSYLKQKIPAEMKGHNDDWKAEVRVYSLHQIVKIYVGSHWYETYLQTLLKCPELLSNCKKVYWITYGQSLLIHGDGQIFRHILNFLRLGKLFLPSEFKEWSLFCQEAEEYRIPSLFEALYQCDGYRLWVKKHETYDEASFPFRRLNIVTWDKEREFSKDPKEEHSYTAVDFSNWCVNTWSKIKDMQDSKGENEKYTRMISQTRGTKRRNKSGGYHQSTDIGENSSYCKHSASPPRKKGERGNLAKKSENRNSATPIQKLISLVKEWDMVNSKRCEFRHVTISSSNLADNVFCHKTLENGGDIKDPADRSPAKISHGVQENDQTIQAAFSAEEKYLEQHASKQNLPVTLPAEKHRFSTIRETYPMEKMAAFKEWRGQEQTEKDIVFLSFALAREEIFYARKCHCFLTDIILNSIRQKDAREITAKVVRLVHRLWTQQITPREFVADVLNTNPFNDDGPVHEKLLRWVEFTLPFAWKYSHCIDLLVKKGYSKSISYFGLGK